MTKNKVEKKLQVLAAPGEWNPLNQAITICSNVHSNATNTSFWDMWLTMSGAQVFTPCNITQQFSPAEIALADFTQIQKINASSHLVALLDEDHKISEFIIPWIHHALATGKTIYTDTPLDKNVKPVKMRGSGLLKELVVFPLSKITLDAYLEEPIPQGIKPQAKQPARRDQEREPVIPVSMADADSDD